MLPEEHANAPAALNASNLMHTQHVVSAAEGMFPPASYSSILIFISSACTTESVLLFNNTYGCLKQLEAPPADAGQVLKYPHVLSFVC